MDVHAKDVRSYNMSRIRSKDTKPEVRVRKYLFSKGYRYRKNDSRYPGRPDIVLPKYHIIILVNGCFWHLHSGCRYASIPKTNADFWTKKLERNKRRDEEIMSQLNELGWKVLVVWQCEINGSRFVPRMEALIKQINGDTTKVDVT